MFQVINIALIVGGFVRDSNFILDTLLIVDKV